MSHRTSIAIVAAVGVIAGALGFAFGKASPTPPAAAKNPTPAATPITAPSTAELIGQRPLADLNADIRDVVTEAMALTKSGDPLAGLTTLLAIEDSSDRTEALIEMIGNLPADHLRTLMTSILADTESDALEGLFEGELVGFSLMDRWAEVDIEGVYDFIESPAPAGEDNFFGGHSIFRVLAMAFVARHDPQRAMKTAYAITPSDKEATDTMAGYAAMGVTLGDPAAAVRLMREQPEDSEFDVSEIFEVLGSRVAEALPEALKFPAGEKRQALLTELFNSWGTAQPEAAIAAVMALEDPDERKAFIQDAVRGLSDTEPQLAAELVANLPAGPERDAVEYQAASDWLESDPLAAMQWAQQHLDISEQLGLLSEASENISPQIGMELLGKMEPEQRDLYFEKLQLNDPGHFIRIAIGNDPQGTLDWLRDMDALSATDGLGSPFALALKDQPPAEAMAVIAGIEDSDFREAFVGIIGAEAGRSDPEAAMAWAQSIDPSSTESRLAHEAAISSWTKEDPAAAAEYAQTGSDTSAIIIVTHHWAQSDAESAFRWLHQMEDGDADALRGHLTEPHGGQLLASWSKQNPAGAVETLMSFPEDIAPQYVGRVFNQWTADEPNRASAYINDHLEDGPARDAAVQALVRQIQDNNLAEAAAWARTISNPGLMNSTLESLATQ